MRLIRLAACMLAMLLPLPGRAQAPPAPAPLTQEQREAGIRAAWEAAASAMQRGPAALPLIDQARLDLPRDMVFVPARETVALLRAYGNLPSEETTVGLVTSETASWTVVVRFVKEGYVRDDDAKDWNADDLLASLREGTEEANRDRVRRGFPESEIIGWLAPPAYDAASHRLVWALASKTKGAPDQPERNVNYNTYALGRDGYFSLNLLTTSSRLAADRPVVAALLASLGYVDGKRYEDFSSGTDRVAEYGLAALVGAVAAKKLGLLAVIGAFVVKFAKVGLIAAAAFGAGVMRFFRGKGPSA
jgi:uncharacterized membrane-anchored protein